MSLFLLHLKPSFHNSKGIFKKFIILRNKENVYIEREGHREIAKKFGSWQKDGKIAANVTDQRKVASKTQVSMPHKVSEMLRR